MGAWFQRLYEATAGLHGRLGIGEADVAAATDGRERIRWLGGGDAGTESTSILEIQQLS